MGLSLALAVLIACALGFGIYMESVGRASGLVEGYAAAWANTPQGKAAYQLAQAGSIDTLTRCDLPICRGGGSRKGRATPTKGLGVNSTAGGSSQTPRLGRGRDTEPVLLFFIKRKTCLTSTIPRIYHTVKILMVCVRLPFYPWLYKYLK